MSLGMCGSGPIVARVGTRRCKPPRRRCGLRGELSSVSVDLRQMYYDNPPNYGWLPYWRLWTLARRRAPLRVGVRGGVDGRRCQHAHAQSQYVMARPHAGLAGGWGQERGDASEGGDTAFPQSLDTPVRTKKHICLENTATLRPHLPRPPRKPGAWRRRRWQPPQNGQASLPARDKIRFLALHLV